MGKIGVYLAKAVLSSFLVVFILLFVLSNSFSQTISEKSIVETISSAGASIVAEKIISEYNLSEENLQELYQRLKNECLNETIIKLPKMNITVQCFEIRDKGPQEVKEILTSKISESIQGQFVQGVEKTNIDDYLSYLAKIRYPLLIVAILISAVLFFLAQPKYHFLMNVGVVFMVSGSPYFVVNNISTPYTQGFSSFIREMFANVTRHLSMIMILGVAFMLLWFLMLLMDKNKKKDKKKES